MSVVNWVSSIRSNQGFFVEFSEERFVRCSPDQGANGILVCDDSLALGKRSTDGHFCGLS